ncbi:MAG: hypothetical protein KBT30_02480, partial [Clostridiales bacterium]|nr:hypothetical protein [Candidatus Apopatousia equi]
PHPSQKDIDHNFVGDYELIVWKPIPMKIIQAMEDEIKRFNLFKLKHENIKYDDKYSTKKLDELCEEL